MRILHLDSGREMRGGQWQVLRLLEGLRAAGYHNVLLARPGSPLDTEMRRRAFEVYPCNLYSAANQVRTADIIHAHDAHSHSVAALTCARPLVVARRVAFPLQGSLASRWKQTRANHYIAVSNFVKNVLLQARIEPSRVSIVYDGVPPQPPSRGTEILAPYSADPRKGMQLALEAAKLAGHAVHLSRNLENDLSRARVFLYITHSEGLGSAVLLAMAAGVPVIASNVGGLPEIVEHEHTGLLTANTPQAIAEAVRRLMSDPDLTRCVAVRARALVAEKFSADRMVAGTIAVYEALS